MARPIKETPILKGKDAQNFYDRIETASKRKASPEVIARIKENYAKMVAISKFK